MSNPMSTQFSNVQSCGVGEFTAKLTSTARFRIFRGQSVKVDAATGTSSAPKAYCMITLESPLSTGIDDALAFAEEHGILVPDNGTSTKYASTRVG